MGWNELLPLSITLVLIGLFFWALTQMWVALRRRLSVFLSTLLTAGTVLIPIVLVWVALSSLKPAAPGSEALPKALPSTAPPNTATVRVFFGTDRKPLTFGQAIFSDEPPEGVSDLVLGWCTVSVPRTEHHRIGRVDRPTFWTVNFYNWFENPDRHFIITRRDIANEEGFWSSVQSVVAKGDDKQILLFVHGYNVSFDDAVYRTAQLALDLRFQGASILYSWPSNGRTLRYVADKDRSLATLGSFKTFLRQLSQQSGARTVHVIAHSMGNNSLVHALAELEREEKGNAPHFRQIIMAAPDVDRREYARLADAFQSSADHITLYAADNDRALIASETLHGAPRIGDAKPMFERKGIDSIDASMVIKGFLKHSYFADVRVLDDIERLLSGQTKVPRFGLIGVPDNERARHWRFQP